MKKDAFKYLLAVVIVMLAYLYILNGRYEVIVNDSSVYMFDHWTEKLYVPLQKCALDMKSYEIEKKETGKK